MAEDSEFALNDELQKDSVEINWDQIFQHLRERAQEYPLVLLDNRTIDLLITQFSKEQPSFDSKKLFENLPSLFPLLEGDEKTNSTSA